MLVVIYGKQGCGKCESAKKNLDRLGVHYRYVDLSGPMGGDVPKDWRENGLMDGISAYCQLNDLPVISIDGEFPISYPKAMRHIKRALKAAQKVEAQEAAVA